MAMTEGAGCLRYRDEGAGTPLLLLSGLGAASVSWDPLTQHLGNGHRLVLPENRGTLPDDVPPDRLSIREMADDAVSVLDAVGLRTAHIVGNSMGGMIAQELVLRHPERARSLVLAGTSAGMPSVPVHPALAWHLMRARQTAGAERQRHLDACFLGPASRRRGESSSALEGCLGRLSMTDGPRRQLGAALRWNSYRRLHRVAVPTLVLHGTHDRLFPIGNARLMARLIPTARLMLLPDAGHFFISDAAAAAAGALERFVRDVEDGLVVALTRRERMRAVLATAHEALSPAAPLAAVG